MSNALRLLRTRLAAVAGAAVVLALGATAVADTEDPRSNYILTSFVEETGDELGYGNYAEGPTASSGKQCKATFRVAVGKAFSITSTTVRGPNAKPAVVTIKDPDGAGSARTPSDAARGWTAVSHASDGMKNHDGTWSVWLPRAKSPMTGKLGCAAHERAVRVVFEASY
jgi:hypothetical protein